MAKLGIFTGTSPNNGTGDTLSQGAVKINSNFTEIYNAIGDGTNITNRIAFASTAGIATNVIGGIASVTNFSASGISTIRTLGVTGLSTANNFTVTGISTFTNGPILVGSATSTGTASQRLQVTGGAYVSGSVGIGTTNPLRQLHILGNTVSSELIMEQAGSKPDFRKWNFYADGGNSTTASNFTLRLLNDAGNATTKQYWTINATNNTHRFDDVVLIGTGTSTGTGSQPLQVTGGAYVSGNLGIGTTNPQHKLDVSGDIRSSGTIYGTVATAITATNVIGGIASVTNLSADISTITTLGVTGISTFTNGPILVGSTSATGTASQRLQVTGGAYVSGSVGIGTTNPTSKLHVVGDTQFDGNVRVGISTTSNYIAFRGVFGDGVNASSEDQDGNWKKYTHTYIGERIYDYSTPGERSELLLFKGNDSSASGVGPDRIRLAAGEFRFDTISAGLATAGTFEQVATSANITNKMILTGDGNLGIGTTNPSSLLSVDGSTTIGTRLLDMTGVSSTFTTVGSNTFVVPAGVTKISAVLIGGGGAGGGGSAGGNGAGGQGGGGGGLAYINDYPVTPGQSLTVIVGAGGAGGTGNGGNGGDSSITGITTAFGGKGGTAGQAEGTANGLGGSGTRVPGSNGNIFVGGTGGTATLNVGAGGGGAAGYSGNGGNGGNGSIVNGGAAGSGGAGGGGGAPTASGSGGGGVGVLGQGTSGQVSNGVGNAGSGGFNGSLGDTGNGASGGLYGGGGGGGDGNAGSVTSGGNGAQGIVRIIWSPNSKFSRLFPTNQVGNSINQ